MIEDTLKANPGMRETYRAYGRLQICASRIEKLEAELIALNANGASGSKVKETIDQISQAKARLKEQHSEALRCLGKEDELRTQLGFPPLELKVLKSAHESLRKYEEIFQEHDVVAV